MKLRIVALILAMTCMSWAQTATQNNPSAAASADKAKCACCDKMASDSKDGHAACMRKGQKMADGKQMSSCCAGKEGASCCGGKDAKSCMKGDKAMTSCCKDGCGKEKAASCCDRKAGNGCGKGCCGANKTEKPA